MKISNAFKTGKALQWACDNPRQVDDMQEYLDRHFAYLMLDLDDGSDPTWDEALYQSKLFDPAYWMLEGCIEYGINGQYDYDPDKIKCQYVSGCYEPRNYGDILKISGVEYRYISSIGLPQEMEHQAENDKLAYEYRGHSFIRVLDPEIDKEYPGV